MGLTNPAALWLLLFLPLPLLASRKRPRVRRVVSNLYLWQEAVRRSGGSIAPRRRRLTSQVLVQMACIGTFAFSLAGPELAPKTPRTTLVFDVSASMDARDDGGSTRLEAARARAKAMIRELPRFARVRVIVATTVPRQLGEWAASDGLLLNAIDGLASTAGAADLATAIEVAAADTDIANVIAFTDTDIPPAGNDGERSKVQWVRLGRRADNVAVTRVTVRRPELGTRRGIVLVSLRNYAEKAREADVEISGDGLVARRRRVQLPPAGSQTIDVELPDIGRFVTATLVGRDALSIDDSRSIAVPAASAIRVALIGLRGSFVERALEVNRSLSVRRYDEIAALKVEPAESFDALVCDSCDESAESDIPSLAVVDGNGESVRDVVRVVSPAHSLARNVEPGWQPATVASVQPASDEGETVLRVGSARVVRAIERNGRRRVVMQRDLTESEFVLSPAFPILVANTVGWLARRHALPREVTAGEPLTFTLPASREHRIRVFGPDGRPRNTRQQQALHIVADTDTAGLYRVEINGSEHVVAVNPNVETESNLSMMQHAFLPELEGSSPSVRAPSGIASVLLLLAAALLAFESRVRVTGD